MKDQNQIIKSPELHQLLKDYSRKNSQKIEPEIIYGIYDNSSASIFTQLNDWLIDHSKVPLERKSYFYHLLAVMIDAGIPILQALKILKEKEENLRFRRILNTLHFEVTRGKNLSEAMQRFPEVFSESEQGVVQSGEAIGKLNDMLNRLAEQIEKTHQIQMKLKNSAAYPLFVLGTLILVGTALMIWIVPNLLQILTESGTDPANYPLPTKILIGFTNLLTNYWWALIAGGLGLWLIFKIFISTTIGGFKYDYFKLRLPVVGTLLRKYYVLRFVSLLGVLISSGMPVIKSLQIIANSLSNELYNLKTWEIIGQVQMGEQISDNMATSPFLFPGPVIQMLSTAEKTASIGQISEKISKQYDREINNSLKTLTSLFEPTMIVLVALAVGLLALAILLPIFELAQNAQNI